MARLIDSLLVRIGLIFICGLVVLQVAIAALLLWPDGRGRPQSQIGELMLWNSARAPARLGP